MNKRISILLIAAVLLAALVVLPTLQAAASPSQPQAYLMTPTPDQLGRILYQVQAGDTCIGVSLRYGVDIATLQLLNGIQGECSLIAGSEILLATVEVPPTPGEPTITPTPGEPTPTPLPGFGEVCIQLFNDLNGNAMLEDGENPIPGGAISLSDPVGKVSESGTTTSNPEAPVCFKSLPEGEYSISMAVPEGYNSTTRTTYNLQIQAGDQSLLDFGAQVSSAGEPLPVEEGGRSPMLGILGGLVLVVGAGLGVYAKLITRK